MSDIFQHYVYSSRATFEGFGREALHQKLVVEPDAEYLISSIEVAADKRLIGVVCRMFDNPGWLSVPAGHGLFPVHPEIRCKPGEIISLCWTHSTMRPWWKFWWLFSRPTAILVVQGRKRMIHRAATPGPRKKDEAI